MLDLYTADELKCTRPKDILRFISKRPFRFTNDGLVFIPIPARKRNEYLEFRNKLHYVYCMPMTIQGRGFLLPPFSTHKFLQLVKDHLSISVAKRKYLDSVVEEYEKANVLLYAAGAIEKSPDHGVGSRRALRECLKFAPAEVIDPCDFECNSDYKTFARHLDRTSLKNNYWFTRNVIFNDVAEVQRADAVVVWLDEYIGTGTPAECTLAIVQGKPVYGVVADNFGIDRLNPWMRATITRFFSSNADFRDFLVK